MNKTKWARVKLLLDALRSGKYEQGTGQLRFNNRFCCLGVACDIYNKETNLGKWIVDSYPTLGTLYWTTNRPGEKAIDTTLPNEVRDWFGFSESSGACNLQDLDFAICLADLNDEGNSFEQIANFIESNPPGLFK